MMTENKFYEVVSKFREEVIDKIPYKINLVEILGANENSHTNILAEILRYWRNGSYPFLRSFLNSIIVGEVRPQIENPKIVTQIKYIDALIYEVGKYAIIVENKINWATDQEKQIQRYIEAASRECHIDPMKQKKIWVVYLTDDGRKKVSDISLTPTAKELLDYHDDKSDTPTNHISRYIECNYRDDVLPWLKENVLPACRYSEVELIAMLQQYIGYLEARFAINRRCNEELAERYFDGILRDIGCKPQDSYDFLKELLEQTTSNSGDLGLNISLQERNEFTRAIRLRLDKMLDEDYALSEDDAITAKMDAVCEWLMSHGIGKNIHRLSQWSCVFIQYVVEGQRIKLQFDLGTSEIGVRLFNNDYSSGNLSAKVLSDFPSLRALFFRLFPFCKDEGEWYAHVELGSVKSKSQLFALLEASNIAMLGELFHKCMEDHLNKN